MRSALIASLTAGVLLGGLDFGAGRAAERYSYVGKKCTSMSGLSVVLGGAEVGTIEDADFAQGAACTVIPPTGLANSVALRCYVDGAQTAHIVASTAVALGVAVGAATWCVEVRTVDPAFVE